MALPTSLREVGAALALCWLAACAGGPVAQSPDCAAYVACVQAEDKAAGRATDLARFAAGGPCWGNEDIGALCTRACGKALDRIAAREPGAPRECSR